MALRPGFGGLQGTPPSGTFARRTFLTTLNLPTHSLTASRTLVATDDEKLQQAVERCKESVLQRLGESV